MGIPQNDQELKVGDVVRLNSGGPPMTVIEAVGVNIKCAWDGGKAIYTFPRPCLTQVFQVDWGI